MRPLPRAAPFCERPPPPATTGGLRRASGRAAQTPMPRSREGPYVTGSPGGTPEVRRVVVYLATNTGDKGQTRAESSRRIGPQRFATERTGAGPAQGHTGTQQSNPFVCLQKTFPSCLTEPKIYNSRCPVPCKTVLFAIGRLGSEMRSDPNADDDGCRHSFLVPCRCFFGPGALFSLATRGPRCSGEPSRVGRKGRTGQLPMAFPPGGTPGRSHRRSDPSPSQ